MTPPSSLATERALARVDEVDSRVRSMIALNHGAAPPVSEGPLAGQPLIVKDNIDTADLPTTAGSLALAGIANPRRDAPVVARLREAGMVLLGKANLSEWANFRDAESVSGWSAVGGQTVNPYALDRSPAGSSSGSAAAAAAGISRFSLGSETDGSIVAPAALCGVVGLKPTVGTLPADGVVPIGHTQDSVGPITATVSDAALLMDALTGRDHSTAVEAGVSGLRLGVIRGEFWGFDAGVDAATERAITALAGAGAEITDGLSLAGDGSYLDGPELTVLLSEFAHDLPVYLSTRTGAPQTLEALRDFNRDHADDELAIFGQSLIEAAIEAAPYGLDTYARAKAECLRLSRDEGIDRVLREHRLDALLTPTAARAMPIGTVPEAQAVSCCSSAAAMAGYPLLTVPTELVGGLPAGLAVWGTAGAEAMLLRVGAAYERTRGPFPEPTFVASVG